MKIALCVPGGVDRSGTERVIPCLLWLIERLADAGHEVHVFAARQEKRPGRWPLLGARIHNIGLEPHAPRMFAALAGEHRKGAFDVVHAFWTSSGGVAAAMARWLLGIPYLLTLAGGELAAMPDIAYGGRLRWRGRLATAFAVGAADLIAAPSLFLCNQAKALGIDAEHVPLGVALDRWPLAAPRVRVPGARLRLLHAASLNKVKAQDVLLKACAALHDGGLDFTLTIAGEDTLDGARQRQAADLGLGDRVTFVGFRNHTELRPLFADADLLVMSSRHEAGPLVLLEAAIAGLPTAGTAVGHIADFAPDAALAAPIDDWRALAKAIAHLAANEPLRLTLAVNAQRRAQAWDADATARSFEEMYGRLSRREAQRTRRPFSAAEASLR